MRRGIRLGFLTGCLLATFAGSGLAQADRILVNGVIYTVSGQTSDGETPHVEAMAIQEGRIAGLGSSADILARFRGESTRVTDLEGQTVIPGLIDAHAHVFSLGNALRSVDLMGTSGIEDVAARVAAAAADRAPGEWITGRGWDQNDWAARAFPDHAPLDRAAPENPVLLERVDGHAMWANELAMERAGVTEETPDPPGGRIVRAAGGEPTGIFIDAAAALIEDSVPEADREQLAGDLAAAQQSILSVGLTGIHDMGISREELEIYRQWADSGRLLPRITAYLDGDDAALLAWWMTAGADEMGGGDEDRFRVAGVKLYADGALGSRGAALLAPYSDDPGNEGLLVTPPDSLAALVARVVWVGLQPAIHAIGDRGNRVALDAIAALAGSSSVAPSRPRIEHAQVVALEDIPRFAELGVIASIQPTHATSDMYWAEERVGPARIEGAYAWQRLRAAGAHLACGSDFPVESPNPFHGLYAAVTRQDREGWPAAGWRPAERMTREQALACFTIDAAYAAGLEDEVGSLTAGKRADFLVLDRDIMKVPAGEIWQTAVLRTVIGGEAVYEAAPGEPATRAGR